VLGLYAPYIAARMNAEQGTDYDVDKFINWIFDADSNCRPGFGVIEGNWDGYDVNGLIGSNSNKGGYAFLMNTFDAISTLLPMVRYDSRYAKAIGRWMTNVASNTRYFYPDQVPAEKQSDYYWKEDKDHVIAYEGIQHYSKEGIEFFVSGMKEDVPDIIKTNFGVYGSAHVGYLAAVASNTNQEKILKLDCLATDFFNKKAYPTYLYYNPYEEEKEVEIDVGFPKKSLYDSVQNKILMENVAGIVKLKIPTDSARVIVLIPADSKLKKKGGNIYANDVFIGIDKPSISIISPDKTGITYDKPFKVELKSYIPPDDSIIEFKMSFDNNIIYSGKSIPDYITIDPESLPVKTAYLKAEIITKKSGTDYASIKITILNNKINMVYGANAEEISKSNAVTAGGKITFNNGSAFLQAIDKKSIQARWMSPSFKLDLRKSPLLTLEIESFEPNWICQIRFNKSKVHYIMPEGFINGKITIDIVASIREILVNKDLINDVEEAEIILFSHGKKECYINFKSIQVFYPIN
jgi:hypothetical protein